MIGERKDKGGDEMKKFFSLPHHLTWWSQGCDANLRHLHCRVEKILNFTQIDVTPCGPSDKHFLF